MAAPRFNSSQQTHTGTDGDFVTFDVTIRAGVDYDWLLNSILGYIRHVRADHGTELSDPRECATCFNTIRGWTEAGFGGDDLRALLAGDPAEPIRYRSAPQPSPAADILDTVDEAGQLLCGCGCGARITDRSPSAYFASQECSERWHTDRAAGPLPPDGPTMTVTTGPGRLFLADTPGGDWEECGWTASNSYGDEPPTTAHRPWRPVRGPQPVTPRPAALPATAWLSCLSQFWTDRATVTRVPDGVDINAFGDRQHPHIDPGVWVTVLVPPQDLAEPWMKAVSYTSWCSTCAAETVPFTTSRSPADVTVTINSPVVVQRCARCVAPRPGRPVFPRVERLDQHLRLHLEDGFARTSAVITAGREFFAGYRMDRVASDAAAVWDRLESQLTAFTTSWQRTDLAAPAPGGDRPYLMDVPPPPRARQPKPWRTAGGGP